MSLRDATLGGEVQEETPGASRGATSTGVLYSWHWETTFHHLVTAGAVTVICVSLRFAQRLWPYNHGR